MGEPETTGPLEILGEPQSPGLGSLYPPASLVAYYSNEHQAAQPDPLLIAPQLRAGSGKPIYEEEETASVDPGPAGKV